MKKFIVLITAILFGLVVFAEDSPIASKEVQIGVSGVFIPGAFDSSTEAYVVVNGVFQNGCYQWNRAEINNIDSFNHEVKTFANVAQGMCTMVLVPFLKDVRLGKLTAGQHNLKFLSSDGTYLERSLTIE